MARLPDGWAHSASERRPGRRDAQRTQPLLARDRGENGELLRARKPAGYAAPTPPPPSGVPMPVGGWLAPALARASAHACWAQVILSQEPPPSTHPPRRR